MRLEAFIALLYFVIPEKAVAQNNFSEPCDNPIYCYGPLLEAIQLHHIYKDDKTFVDLALKFDPEIVLANFGKLNLTENNNINQTLKDFINENFVNGTEFQAWEPEDWDANPRFLSNISDPVLQNWARQLHGFWEELGRKIKEEVNTQKDHYSMLYVSHPVIIPGGRFKEFYYWDSYWIQKGLLVSEMSQTVQGMIENFFEMVMSIGYVPNGGRIYYERSQPPLLIPMVKNFYDYTKNQTFISRNIEIMKQEFQFFMEHRTVNFTLDGKNYTMARYNVDLKGPRPESFSKDYELVEPLNISGDEKEILYANLKAGAESGWDFSTRWFVLPDDNSTSTGNLSHVKTRDILPADLNGFLYWNAVILTEFCGLINDTAACNAEEYKVIAENFRTAINEVMWDEATGSWYDYDYVRHQLRKDFYPSNLVPLWVNAHNGDSNVVAKVVQYFKDQGVDKYAGGVPTSLKHSGEQWDFPNGWAPLNHIVVEAFENSGSVEAKALAFSLAQKWIWNNYKAYEETQLMFEKYDVTAIGLPGGGGEYETVVGFGWSNGVVLDFLKMYGTILTSEKEGNSSGSASRTTWRFGGTIFITTLSFLWLHLH